MPVPDMGPEELLAGTITTMQSICLGCIMLMAGLGQRPAVEPGQASGSLHSFWWQAGLVQASPPVQDTNLRLCHGRAAPSL